MCGRRRDGQAGGKRMAKVTYRGRCPHPKAYSYKVSVNSRLKATKIIGQRISFYRQRIPEPSCPRKEAVDIDMFVTSWNGDDFS